MSRVRFLTAAYGDIRTGFDWYESQRPGLGEQFLIAIGSALADVTAYPEAYPVVHRDTRRVLMERFPYGLFFRHAGDEILVVACLHAARDPERWRARLDG